MENFSFSTSRVLFEHPLMLAAQGELHKLYKFNERNATNFPVAFSATHSHPLQTAAVLLESIPYGLLTLNYVNGF